MEMVLGAGVELGRSEWSCERESRRGARGVSAVDGRRSTVDGVPALGDYSSIGSSNEAKRRRVQGGKRATGSWAGIGRESSELCCGSRVAAMFTMSCVEVAGE